MRGRSFMNLGEILIFGAVVAAFFVLTQGVYAFGHPDTTAPSIAFTKPGVGFPINPRITGSAAVSFEAKDTTPDDRGGEVVSCTLSTKNANEAWVDRDSITCNADFIVQDTWCNKEGTNNCGVRIHACDNNDRCVQAERFFSIDYTPPVIEISSNRSDPTQKTSGEFLFSASDAYGIQRIGCGLDVPIGPLLVCNISKSYFGLKDGIHSFRVAGTDRAGNSTEKTLTWEIDSTPPAGLGNFTAFGATYFSEILDWIAPKEDGTGGGVSAQYDIRYSTVPINETNWKDATALVYREHQAVPPKFPGSQEQITIGPQNIQDLESPRSLGLLSDFNLLSANTRHYFGVKTRDEKWNWSGISTPTNTNGLWTLRDFCDYDADRLYSSRPGCGAVSRQCNPNTQSCDFYDYPSDWGLPGPWPADKASSDEWIQAFGATARDLDQDGQDVARGRTGVRVGGYTEASGKDWYDNSFTSDLTLLATLPTLKQLSYTINDLDLDTFVSRSWKEEFGSNEPSEPDEIQPDISTDENISISGRIYPGARESTCFNCTAYNPDPATGRIPAGKTEATINKNRAVGQIEAYYTNLGTGEWEVIKETTTQGGTLNTGRKINAASANCRDAVNNDLLSGTDSSDDPADPKREINCPTQFGITKAPQPTTKIAQTATVSTLTAAIFPRVGLVQCGRHADDYTTPIDESADCGFCQLFVLSGNLINLMVSRLMPILAALSVVVGGLMMILSVGRPEIFAQGKNIIRWAFSAYILTLLAWLVLTMVFSLFGIAKWTGFTPERGDIKQLSETSLTVGSQRFSENAWKEYAVEIRSPEGEKVIRKITSNTSDTLMLDESQPFQMSPDETYRYHILHTGWWNFVCGISTSVEGDFAAAPASGIAPFTVDFTDLSEGDGITAWSWDFGDGTTSNLQSPKHTYTTDGPHTVRLTVEGPGGSSSGTKTIYHAPTAAFSSSSPYGRGPLRVQFQDASTGQVTAWSWDFDGDNREDSSEQNPVHTYTAPGPYRVKLTVSGPGGQDVTSKLDYIFVYPDPPGPVADFATSTIPNTLIALTDNRSFDVTPAPAEDHITAWNWDFGDGRGLSAVEEPKYFYGSRAAPYLLSLTVVGPGGENTTTTAISFAPGANFASDKISGVVPLTLRLKDSSTGTVSGLTWDFGDGSSPGSAQLGASINHTYSKNGVYRVTLKARGPTGESELRRASYIVVAPRASFAYSSVESSDPTRSGNCIGFSGCTVGPDGAEVRFVNNSSCEGACVSHWDFGDGGTEIVNGLGDVTYTYMGVSEVYTVRLTVTGPGGGDTMTRKNYIRIAPWAQIDPMEAGPFTRTLVYDCDGLVSEDSPVSVSFSDVSRPQEFIQSRSWSGGGFQDSVTREFTNNGSVSLTVVGNSGQSDTAVANVQIHINTIDTCPPPPGPESSPAAKPGPTTFEQLTEQAQQFFQDLFNFIPGLGSSESPEPAPVFESTPENVDLDIDI